MENASRLVVFGSSDTYGQGLPDCTLDAPSNYAWPSLIGQRLSLPVHNFARPGASNKEILLSVINADIKQDDLVIVCWTHVNRSCLISDDGSIIQIFPKATISQAKSFYKLYDIKNLIIDSLLEISHANAILANKGYKVHHFYTDHFLSSRKKYVPVDAHLVEIDTRIHHIDVASDGTHPGVMSHISISDYVYRILNE